MMSLCVMTCPTHGDWTYSSDRPSPCPGCVSGYLASGVLTIRDHFAAQIAPALLVASSAAISATKFDAEKLAETAYQIADALLRARART